MENFKVETDLATILVRLDAKIDKLDEKIDKLEEKLDAKIDKLEEKIDAKIDRLDEKIDNLTVEMSTVKGEIKTLDSKIDGLEKRISNSEFTNRGIFVGLIVIIFGSVAKYLGLLPEN